MERNRNALNNYTNRKYKQTNKGRLSTGVKGKTTKLTCAQKLIEVKDERNKKKKFLKFLHLYFAIQAKVKHFMH